MGEWLRTNCLHSEGLTLSVAPAKLIGTEARKKYARHITSFIKETIVYVLKK